MLMEEDETQEAAAIEEQAVTPEDSPKRKLEGLAARVSELEGELKTEKARSDDYYRRLQYLQADLENYRKRAGKEGGEGKGVGSKFSPDLHDAALRVSSDSEEGTIVEEIRPGYLLKGRVLRPSIVKVAEKQASEEAKTDQEEEE